MSHPTPEQWLGLLLVTESNRPHEWPAIAWVVRNRVASRRFPSTVEKVVLQPSQFSRFNDWRHELAEGGPAAVWDAACHWSTVQGLDHLRHLAEIEATEVLDMPPGSGPFGQKVLHYYSPRSMRPPHSVPGWWWTEIVREVPVPGIDPDRFRFGESR